MTTGSVFAASGSSGSNSKLEVDLFADALEVGVVGDARDDGAQQDAVDFLDHLGRLARVDDGDVLRRGDGHNPVGETERNQHLVAQNYPCLLARGYRRSFFEDGC
ncbi:MAG: hypothetical protein V5A27_01940 [Halapricum sp.]